MPQPVITARSLGKQYQLGTYEPTKSFREALSRSAARAMRRVRGGASANARGADASASFWALSDIDLDVQKGEVLGVLGRNGAGKSTLLKVLSRITEPTTGRIELRGRVASLLEVGTGFHSELTGRENIYLNGTILGMRRSEIARKFDEIVAFAGVERFIDTPVKRYSSGMYVRLAFAVAAHLEPEIMIVDEVLAVGDAEFQRKCLGKMSDVAHQGRTVLFVSHSMPAIQGLCTRAVVLNAGRVMVDADVETAVAQYIELGRARKGADDRQLVRSGGHVPRTVEVTRIELLVDGAPSASVWSGQSCTFRVHYRALTPEAIGTRFSPQLRLKADGQAVMTVWPNLIGGAGVPIERMEGAVDCHIERWPLREKQVKVELVSFVGVEVQEIVPEAFDFDSHDGDYHGSGVTPHSADAMVYLDQRWAHAAGR